MRILLLHSIQRALDGTRRDGAFLGLFPRSDGVPRNPRRAPDGEAVDGLSRSACEKCSAGRLRVVLSRRRNSNSAVAGQYPESGMPRPPAAVVGGPLGEGARKRGGLAVPTGAAPAKPLTSRSR